MFAQSPSKAPIESPPSAVPPVNQESPRLTEQLQEIARRHEICYEVSPRWSTYKGRIVRTGFQLELRGVNDHASEEGVSHSVPGCWRCLEAFEEMRQIAEWILPRDERPSRCEIQAFDHALHIAPPRRNCRSEVVVSVHIKHRGDFNDSANRCLTEIRERLAELGIHERLLAQIRQTVK